MNDTNTTHDHSKPPATLLAAYEKLLAHVQDRREAVQKLDQFLRNETSWLTSPASTRFHLAHASGLLEHSVNVAKALQRAANRAKELGLRTNTPVYVDRNGKTVDLTAESRRRAA
jgi:hypothetical protein